MFVGFGVYNITQQTWDDTNVQPLQGDSGSSVVVRSITASPSQSNVLMVAGSFAQAGSTPCRSICAYDIVNRQWSALGDGIQGDVSSVAYAGVSLCIVSLIFFKPNNCSRPRKMLSLLEVPSHLPTAHQPMSRPSPCLTRPGLRLADLMPCLGLSLLWRSTTVI